MSVKNCLGSKFSYNADNEQLSAAEAILQQYNRIKELSPTAELKGIDALVEFIQRENGNLNEGQLKIEDLLDPNVEDFLNLDNTTSLNSVVGTKNAYSTSDRFFNFEENSEVRADEVLDNILTNFSSLKPAAQEIVKSLIPVVAKSHAKVRLIHEARMSPGAFMTYDPNLNIIYISREKIDKNTPERAVTAFLHEVVHSVTVHSYIKSSKTAAEQELRDVIDTMYEKYKNLSDYDTLTTNNERANPEYYGFTKPEEFIAELMSNPIFQNRIKQLEKEEGSNLWTKLLDLLRQIFRIQKTAETSEAEKLIKQISEAIINDTTIPTNSYEAIQLLMIAEEEESTPLYQEDTIEKKLKKTLDSIKDNLDESIRKYDVLIRKTKKDPSRIETYSKRLKTLLSDIESYDEQQQWHAVTLFINELNSNLNSLQRKFDQAEFSDADIQKTINEYSKYLQSHSLVGDISKFIAAAKANVDSIPVNKSDLLILEKSLINSTGLYSQLSLNFDAHLRKALILRLNNRKYAYKVVTDKEIELRQVHKARNISEPVDTWVSRQINTVYKDEIDAAVLQYVTELVENPDFDISKATMFFNSGLNTNSKMVQLFQNLVNETRNKIIERTRAKDLEFRDLFNEFIEGQKNSKPSELYKSMLEYDKEGKAYLKSEYKLEFREKYNEQLQKFTNHKNTIYAKYGSNSPQWKNVYSESDFKTWLDENTIIIDKKTLPAEKWKSDTSNMTAVEKKVLLKFRETIDTANDQTFGFKSLKSIPIRGAVYYSLPAVTKKNLERIVEGDLGGSVKDFTKDLTSIRTDDVGYEESNKKDKTTVENIGLDKKPIYYVKVHYRGNLDASQQSLDLFTLMRLEMKNGISYEEKHDQEAFLSTLVDVAKEKEYYRTSGLKTMVLGKNVKRNKSLLIPGTESNTYKRLVGLMESNIYDILHKDGGKMGVFDTNKAVGFLNGWTAGVGMTLNEVTAAANVLNGKAQMFLETVAGNVISAKSLAKAEKIYFSTLIDNLKDVNAPINSAFVNQLTDEFDTFGLIGVSAKQAFIKNTLLKAKGNGQSLQFMQEGGEHWMQSTLTMGILDTIKVMNANNDFIDQQGNVVKDKNKAASLLDMYSVNEKGVLVVSPLVVYTTKSSGIKYNEGGKVKVMSLIKKKMFDTMGNYDSNMQPEAMRHWYGKLFMMYRKYLVPMGVTRWRGFVYFRTAKDDLADNQKFYSEALQEYEEGYYTTFTRYIVNGLLPAIKKMEFKLLSTNWNELTDYEKKNIHKTVVEITLTAGILPALGMLLSAANADDDDKFLWFLLLQTRRLESELSAYRNINEQYRIFNSPIPSVRMLQNATSLLSRLINPNEIGEKYKSGPRKGTYKIYRDATRLTPILNSTNITYKEKYEYILNMTN